MGTLVNDFATGVPHPRLRPYVSTYTGYRIEGAAPGGHNNYRNCHAASTVLRHRLEAKAYGMLRNDAIGAFPTGCAAYFRAYRIKN